MENIWLALNLLQPWHWLALSVVLVAIDSILVGGFLLGGALASFLLCITLLFFKDMLWYQQLTLFSILTVVFTSVFSRTFLKYRENEDSNLINDRAAQIIGREFVLEHDIDTLGSKIQIGDTLWKVKAEKTLCEGARVKVVDSHEMVLVLVEVI
jgi:inner membrane protein